MSLGVLHLSSQEVGRVFDLELVSQCSSGPPRKAKTSLCFEVSNVGGRVKVKGTSGIELAYGAAWYLRTRCNMSFSWERTGGNQVKIPSSWPPAEAVTKYRTVPMSYFNNVVTFSYSYVWYDFSAWERWLDWAALSGINLVTAYTGQEEIYRKTFRDFGVSDEHFANWSNGVAWLAWSRGQSMHGVGSDCGDACGLVGGLGGPESGRGCFLCGHMWVRYATAGILDEGSMAAARADLEAQPCIGHGFSVAHLPRQRAADFQEPIS